MHMHMHIHTCTCTITFPSCPSILYSAMPFGHERLCGAPSVYISCIITPRCSYHCPHEERSCDQTQTRGARIDTHNARTHSHVHEYARIHAHAYAHAFTSSTQAYAAARAAPNTNSAPHTHTYHATQTRTHESRRRVWEAAAARTYVCVDVHASQPACVSVNKRAPQRH